MLLCCSVVLASNGSCSKKDVAVAANCGLVGSCKVNRGELGTRLLSFGRIIVSGMEEVALKTTCTASVPNCPGGTVKAGCTGVYQPLEIMG